VSWRPDNGTGRVAEYWLAFCALSSLVSFGCFAVLFWGLGIPVPISVMVAVPVGLVAGYMLAKLRIIRWVAAGVLELVMAIT